MKRRRRHSITLVSLQHFLRGRRLDLLKIDIDNSAIEVELIVALERMAAAQQARPRARPRARPSFRRPTSHTLGATAKEGGRKAGVARPDSPFATRHACWR
mmetsp:Transcript_21010/g.56569  ORF Transcript_21010/g.56569 Transcript_21010/m.56569 type:complete len:101 (+) Transcript_21010:122-424(+)